MPASSGVMGEEFESVPLQPFLHQVSGHTGMFRFDDQTVCKPLNVREYNFYLNVPHNLKQFTAEFRGTIEVEIREDSDGYVTIMGRLPMSTKWQKSSNGENLAGRAQQTDKKEEGQHSLRLLRSGSVEVSTQTDQVFHSRDSDRKTENINPWSLRCHKKTLSKLRKANQGPVTHCKFILLENVAAQFCHPSILDLKMGTRQHGDDVSPDKKERFMKKCQNTTSSSLGVRVCGMQVYQEDSDKYICVNKYYGRSLGVDGFKQTLHQFLHNGYELRKDLLDSIIKKLKDLHRQVQSLDTYRFYSSSLLVMYDVRSQDKDVEEASAQSNIVDVRMIDFAHSTHSGFQNDTTVHTGPDQGYLYGLKSLIDVFTDMR
ncbi:inositol hexakisphosphate kinase 1-like [Saccostrea cucullata]|uniref:inositol hexakisphosphate kinase 1-like n=1 Tax=Saccostrea cuccullata TaxID=36930 RepID=UPI002ED2ADF9